MILVKNSQISVREENLRTVKIITIGLNLGILIFGLICYSIYQGTSVQSAQNVQFLDILLSSLLVVSLVSYISFIFLSKRIFVKILKTSKNNIIMAITVFHFIKLSLFELPAFFGLVIILLSIQNYVIFEFDYFLLGLIPAIILFVYSIISYPRVDKVNSYLDDIYRDMKNSSSK